MNNKKGISAVVATVLIILITIAAITIVWAIVKPFVVDTAEGAIECFDANTALSIENKGFTCYNAGTDLNVQVSYGRENVSLSGIQFLISEGGDTTSIEERVSTNLPSPNGEKVVTMAYSGTPDSVAIAPIIVVGNSETTCDKSAPVTLEAC